MLTIPNKAKERMGKGELALGLGLRHSRTVEVGRVLATCGYDFAFIDLEHGAMGLEVAAELSIACHDAGVTPLVRVPGYEHHFAGRLLDSGAMGLIFPHVDTPQLARELVAHCKFPPLGHRSVGGPMAQLGFRAAPLAEASAAVNRDTTIVMMVETPQAIRNADAIAGVEGVDVVFIGSNDLCMEWGIPQQFDSPKLEAAMETVVAACRAHGKTPGFGGVYDEERVARFVAMGMRFILAGSDIAMLIAGAGRRADFLRKLQT